MRLLLFNLATDLDDPVLGFATRWIQSLARRVEFVYVITMRAGRVEVPRNVQVYSVGKERGYSRPRRAVEFYRLLFKVLREGEVDICFSHMIPIFTIMAAPVLRSFRVPIVTWYAHRKVTWILKLAHHLSDKMVASARASYRYKHDKLVVVGQGIDTELFSPNDVRAEGTLFLLSVGRLSPLKDPLTLLKAVHLLKQRGINVRCVLIGDAPDRDRTYASRLRQYVREAKLEDVVQFKGAVPHHEVVWWYRRCFLHVNCSPSDHSLDKSVLEAMACGKPSLTSILGFKETMGRWADLLIFRHRDAQDLARKIEAIWRMPPAERERMGADLRRSVVERHSLERLADRLVDLFEKILAQRRQRRQGDR